MFQVPYGKTALQFSLPPGMVGTAALSHPAQPLENVHAAIREALDHPVGSPRLRDIARTAAQHPCRVCIVFTDATRACPDDILIPMLLAELEEAGVRDQDITLLCGTGMHRPSTTAEKIAKLGAPAAGGQSLAGDLRLVNRYRVIDNEPQNPAMLAEIAPVQGAVPLRPYIHRAVVEADLVIATGIVEPHQYAGYSGGRKTVAIGAAGEAFIGHTHGPAYIDHPGVRLGVIEGNPFHEVITEVARQAGLRFILNVVLDENKRLLRAAAGDPDHAFHSLVEFARSVYEVPISQQYDIVVGGVGYPKDSNLYQASRAPSYLFFAPTPVVRPGGFFIIPARCEEGAGAGIGDQRFLAALRDAPDVQFILDDARRNGYPPGQQRAFVLAKVLEQARVVIVGSECPDLVAACKMIPAATLDEAFALAQSALNRSDPIEVLVVPHALLTLPCMQSIRDDHNSLS